ncbi:hypothetical protein EB796_000841 [Bugula neritina]|uniref:Uncharacterized protein n=1 Tax=Bugula neritina TaxID=10212 RepID=A0A7J7KRT5_BUGNE|nr:hypothetical protein EB796_000841 [Bugula neritina]
MVQYWLPTANENSPTAAIRRAFVANTSISSCSNSSSENNSIDESKCAYDFNSNSSQPNVKSCSNLKC